MKKDIKALHQDIDNIDNKIKELFLERMNISRDILEYKKSHNLPLNNDKEEHDSREKIIKDPNVIISKFFPMVNEALLNASKAYQEDLYNYDTIYPKTTKIAYFGIGHSNTYIGLVKMLGDQGYKQANDTTFIKDTEEVVLIETASMDDLKNKMVRKEVNQAFIPYVNDNAGVVMDTYWLMRQISFSFLKKYQDTIILYLYVPNRVKEIAKDDYLKLDTIYSNLPAFNQCSDFINTYMPYATFKKSSSTTQAIEDMLEDESHLASCFANEEALKDKRIKRFKDVTTSNNKGSITKYLLIEYKEDDTLLDKQEDYASYFEGYYIYISDKKEGHDFSVDAKSYRAVEIKRDENGYLKMFIYTFGNKTSLIAHSKNVTTYKDARTKEICLMYEYESEDISKNVNGVAFLRSNEEDLRHKNKKIKGEYLGKDNGKSGILEYHRIEHKEFLLLVED